MTKQQESFHGEGSGFKSLESGSQLKASYVRSGRSVGLKGGGMRLLGLADPAAGILIEQLLAATGPFPAGFHALVGPIGLQHAGLYVVFKISLQCRDEPRLGCLIFD